MLEEIDSVESAMEQVLDELIHLDLNVFDCDDLRQLFTDNMLEISPAEGFMED